MSQVITQKWQDPDYREKTVAAIRISYDRRMKERLNQLSCDISPGGESWTTHQEERRINFNVLYS